MYFTPHLWNCQQFYCTFVEFVVLHKILLPFLWNIQGVLALDITLSRIINELKVLKKTQTDLTDYIGISDSSFGNWKKGLNTSYKKYIHVIAEYLNVSVEYLRGETDIKTKKPLSENEERLKELFDLTADLSEAEIQLLKAYAAGIKANRENH